MDSARTPGCYLLLLELTEARLVSVGRLGTFEFPTGWYVYVGSALGGLEQRVARHLRPSPVRRWHLDYLRAEAPVGAVYLLPGPHRHECELARAILALPDTSIPAPRFGASDCRCPAHLVRFPGISDVRGRISDLLTDWAIEHVIARPLLRPFEDEERSQGSMGRGLHTL